MDVSAQTLPPDLAEFVRFKMTTGEYTSENEVLCEALSFLRERDELQRQRLERLQREIQFGRDQLDRGDSKPFDAGEIKAELRRRLAVDAEH